MAQPSRTLFVLGSGPGIGRSIASLFAEKRYGKLALFARTAAKLVADADAIIETVSDRNIVIKTYPVDMTETAGLKEALDQAERELGLPECVFYNAARVQPSSILESDISEIEYDFKINVSTLYGVAQRCMPNLVRLAAQTPSSTATRARPALIVTSSLLPHYPNPAVFSLSIAKAAQRSLLDGLEQAYRGKGVLIGAINVQGAVSPETEGQNPSNIAKET